MTTPFALRLGIFNAAILRVIVIGFPGVPEETTIKFGFDVTVLLRAFLRSTSVAETGITL